MKAIFSCLAAFVLLSSTSCKKDDDDPKPVTPTKENLTGSYKLTAATVAGVNIFNNSNESMNLYEACQRDDVYKLNADLSYQVADEGTQCSPSGSYTGTWSFVNSTTIVLDGETATITSFDGKNLSVSSVQGGFTISSTFVKQ
ncbi:MAG TPA: lipocalin family protein [Flavisolibacter sp.]|nr:lipocalin family protein [Flavisolibacter sp.]